MNITISGKHIKVTEAMKNYAHEKASKFERIWHGINKVQLIMEVEHDEHIVEAILSIDGSDNIVSTTKASDMYAALDLMEEKTEHQLRRLKSKKQDHHPHVRQAKASSASQEPSYQDIINEEMNPS